jgi:hypothetical protein
MNAKKKVLKNQAKSTLATWYFMVIKTKSQVGILWKICPILDSPIKPGNDRIISSCTV